MEKGERLHHFLVNDTSARWKALLLSVLVGSSVGMLSSSMLMFNLRQSCVMDALATILTFIWKIYTHCKAEPEVGECVSCGEYFGDADIEYCPKSQRKCGHHCNHIWSHDACDWCGFDVSAAVKELQ
jgi:hypothetical protein